MASTYSAGARHVKVPTSTTTPPRARARRRGQRAGAGLLLLTRLRTRCPDVRLVFCTSSRAAATYRKDALAAGAYAVLTDRGAILPLIGLG